MHLPSPSEIDAKIRDLDLEAGALSYEQARAEAVQAILEEQSPAPALPAGHVLSRSMVAIADGYLEITVTHHEGTAP